MTNRLRSTTLVKLDEWDWDLVEGLEQFLLQRVLAQRSTPESAPALVTTIEYEFRDDHGGMKIGSVAEARERSKAESTTPSSLRLAASVGQPTGIQGWAERQEAVLDVSSSGGRITAVVTFSAIEDHWTRSLKVDCDAWVDRWRIAHPVPVKPSPQAWWRPDLASVRDNLVANVVWLFLGALVVAALGLLALGR